MGKRRVAFNQEFDKVNTIIYSEKDIDIEPCVATIGFFDGVHRGHQYLIESVIGEAHHLGLQSTVITFDNHPRQVLHSDYIPEMLSTTQSKLDMLAKTGVNNCVVLHFDDEMAHFSAYDFIQNVLKNRLNVSKLIIGYDNRFGCNRAEEFDDYVKYGNKLGIEVSRGDAFVFNGVNVSSSVVRRYLREGEIEMANRCLGYPYFITSTVVKGFQQGRTLGFPTANLDTSLIETMLPSLGVYAVKVRILPCLELRRGMMDIGNRPTFGDFKTSVEVNIFNFSNDIYGQNIQVYIHHKIREDKKFDSVEALTEQLKEDKRLVNEQFDKENEV